MRQKESTSIKKFNKIRFEYFKNNENKEEIKKPHKARIKRIYGIFDKLKAEKKDLTVLDIGCADGFISSYFISNNTKVFGLDTSKSNVVKANKRGIKTIVGDASEELPFSSEIFDIVLMGELIEHIFDPDFLLEEANRILKSDGTLILTFPNLSSLANRLRILFGYDLMHFDVSLKNRHGGHIRCFNAYNIKKVLNSNNFLVKKIYGSSVSINPFKRTNSNFGLILGKIFPRLGDLLIVEAQKIN